MRGDLQARLERYAAALVENGFNELEALKASGYAVGSHQYMVRKAHLWMKHPYTQKLIHRMQRKMTERALATATEKRELLWKLAQEGAERRPKTDKEGNPVGEEHADMRAAISAISELNKMDGDLAAVQLQMKGEVKNTVVVKNFTGNKAEGKLEEDTE